VQGSISITRRARGLLPALALVLASSCTSALFWPDHFLYWDPAKLGHEFEEIRVPSYDGTKLYGWYFHHTAHRKDPKSKPKALLFFAHGNGANLSNQFPMLSWVLERGYDFYVFDYRGYGPSEGEKPSADEAIGDTIATLRWADARARSEKVPLAAFGQSLGSALLVRAISDERRRIGDDPPKPAIRFVGLECTFLSFRWAAASVLAQSGWTTWLQPFVLLFFPDTDAPGERIRDLAPTPVLFLHGEEDRLVRIELGREAYAAALPPKEFVAVPGAGHVQAFWGDTKEKYRDLFIDRLEKALRSP
jgi:pimeloyl-ACP methyl ester carboxylesterase